LHTLHCFSLTQCLSFCSYVCHFKWESTSDTKIHTWKFTMVSQAQPFNSMVNSWKNASSGWMALPSSGGRGGHAHCVHMNAELLSIFHVWT
jgi:hypothetical protein